MQSVPPSGWKISSHPASGGPPKFSELHTRWQVRPPSNRLASESEKSTEYSLTQDPPPPPCDPHAADQSSGAVRTTSRIVSPSVRRRIGVSPLDKWTIPPSPMPAYSPAEATGAPKVRYRARHVPGGPRRSSAPAEAPANGSPPEADNQAFWAAGDPWRHCAAFGAKSGLKSFSSGRLRAPLSQRYPESASSLLAGGPLVFPSYFATHCAPVHFSPGQHSLSARQKKAPRPLQHWPGPEVKSQVVTVAKAQQSP